MDVDFEAAAGAVGVAARMHGRGALVWCSTVIRVFPWGPRELNCARPLGVPGCYITCRGCLSRYITALVPLLHVLTTSCSRTADIRAPCGQRQLGAYLAGRPFPVSGIPGTNWQVPQDASNRTTTPNQGLRWPCGTPVDDPTAAGRRGMTGHSRASGQIGLYMPRV